MDKKQSKAENLSDYVDALGDVRAQKQVLELKEKELTEYIKKHAEAGKTIHGKFFTCDVVKSTKRVINALKAFKKLGKDKFLKIASVAITAAQKVMSDEEIDAISDVSEGSVSVRTKAIPQARGIEMPAAQIGETIDL